MDYKKRELLGLRKDCSIGTVKTTYDQLRVKYENMEAANDSAGAALFLAQTFGSEKDVFVIEKINEIHKRLGYLPKLLSRFRYQIVSPFFFALKKS